MSSTVDRWIMLQVEIDSPLDGFGNPVWDSYLLTLRRRRVTIEGVRAKEWQMGLVDGAAHEVVAIEGVPVIDFILKELGLGDG